MVLSVDIGNSNICIGGLAGAGHREIAFTTRMVTRPRCTVDEYAAEMKFCCTAWPWSQRPVRASLYAALFPG